MFKKCLFLVAILAISLAFISLLVNTKEKDETREVEDEIKEEVKYTVCTEWIGVYSSLEELVSDTEVIVTGEVISTESYPVNRLVFTRVYILVDSVQKGEIKQNDIITIVQLGGSYDDAFSPPPEEFPLMIEGKRYELYLKRNTSSNNNTYKVMGGYQGVLEIDENGNRNVLSEKNTLFLEELNQITN